MFGIVQINNKGPLSEINTAEPVYKKVKCIDGTIKYVYHNNLIHLLDRFFLTGNYHTLSPEQRKFIYKYLEEADYLTKEEDAVYEEAEQPILGVGKLGYLRLADSSITFSLRRNSTKNELSPKYVQLDVFLGSQNIG